MTQKEALEVTMAREVLAKYRHEMRGRLQIPLDSVCFRKHFASVAHRHSLVFHLGKIDCSPEEQEDRNQYNLYFGLVRRRVYRSIQRQVQRTNKNAAPRRSTTTPAPHPPKQLSLHMPVPAPQDPAVQDRLKRAREQALAHSLATAG